MKKYFLFIFFIVTTTISLAQSTEADPANKNKPYIPSFNLLSLDSSAMHIKEKLKKNKTVMIILFDPNCDHCEHFAEELVKNKKKFNNVQVIMSSFGSLQQIRSFYKKTSLSQLSNLIIGQDYFYFFSSYYKLSKYPFAALYNKSHKLISAYEQTIDVKQMAEILNK